ncbi:hypothetical protein MMC13_003901 [Lambiella insularis]|nr:hypothetical protein [Lambiella insularis]
MAILKGLIVCVSVEGEQVVEFDDENDDANIVGTNTPPDSMTKYIEAKSDASFELSFHQKSLPTGCVGMNFDVYIDGIHVEASMLDGIDQRCALLGKRTGKNGTWTMEKFRFKDIMLEEDQLVNNHELLGMHLPELGTIIVEVRRIRSRTPVPVNSGNTRRLEIVRDTKVPEKALKGLALSHRTTLDAPTFLTPPRVWITDNIEGKDSHFAKFVFKYRSRRALQIEHIIPRTPSPVPLEKRPLDSLTREEAIELLQRRPVVVKAEVVPEIEPKVKVKLKGKTLKEHDDQASGGPSVVNNGKTFSIVKYVEATSDSDFGVRFGYEPCLDLVRGCEGYAFRIYIDGLFFDSRIFQFSVKYQSQISLNSVVRCVDDAWTEERFRFAEIAPVDAQHVQDPPLRPEESNAIGTIKVVVFRIKNIRTASTSHNHNTVEAHAAHLDEISEQALKERATSHKTSLDPPKKTAALPVMTTDYLDMDGLVPIPHVVLEFRYRSHQALQSENIIPRSPSRNRPAPLVLKFKFKPKASLKRERDDKYDEILASAAIATKPCMSTDANVIDLTGD